MITDIDKGMAIFNELKGICERYGLWYIEAIQHKPDTTLIKVDIEIKVKPN